MARSSKRTVFAACPHDCPDGCAMLVDLEDGKATGVRGNPDHPFTRGGLCVKVNKYTERVYSPERVLHPLKRAGAKGEGRFRAISWEAALAEIGERWTAIIEAEGAEAILPHSYLGAMGVLNGMNVGDAFFNRLGASITERTFCGSGAFTGYFMTVGDTPGTDPEDFRHAKYIVLWAINTISTNLHHWPFIAEAQKNGAKVVVIDPVRTRTARKADWHLALRPGSDGALALGLINAIIAEDLIDHDYVARYTLGFEELKERAGEYPPEKVATITGLAPADIRKLAREFATTEPAVIRSGVAIERHAGGGQAVRAITCLPALVGAWRQIGGGMSLAPEFAFPFNMERILRADWIRPGTRVINQWRLGRALTGELGLDPAIKSLVVYNANPAIVLPEQEKVLAGLARDDLFTVVSEQFVTDTARFADLVLPATTQLEQFELISSWGQYYLAINEPAIAPLGEAVSNTELFRRLARTMGFNDPYFQRSDEEIALEALDWSDPKLQGMTLDSLKRDGFAKLDMGARAPHAEGNFPTPSGKCEFKSSLAEGGNFVFASFRQGSEEFQAGEPIDPLPNWTPPEDGEGGRYPLNILSPKSHAFINSSFANLPTQARHAGEQHVMINPEDASARNIAEGSRVRVHNARGAFQAVVRITRDVRPGVVVAPMGYWMADGQEGRTVAAVNSDAYADLGRAPTFSDSRVEVSPLS
ncbi:MAG: molybdopterin oxidoreductase family protein [Alphaproteobacteria bacterium]